MRRIMHAIGTAAHCLFGGKTRHYEIGGYLHSGSAIVYDGHMPAIYNQEEA